MHNQRFFVMVAAMLCMGSAAWAEEAKPAAAPVEAAKEQDAAKNFGRTLDEEKAMLRKRLERLEKLTPEQWEAERKGRFERWQRWRKMTPEERQAHRQRLKGCYAKLKDQVKDKDSEERRQMLEACAIEKADPAVAKEEVKKDEVKKDEVKKEEAPAPAAAPAKDDAKKPTEPTAEVKKPE